MWAAKNVFIWAAVTLVAGATRPAQAAPLNVVTVEAPAVVCVFSPGCKVVVSDTTAAIPLPFESGHPFLQSRTFTGEAGSPAAGKTGYEYRVDLTSTTGAVGCLGGLVINFGPIAQLPYKGGTMADVYVVTKGGLGSVGIGSAEQDGDVITFTFDKPLCVTDNVTTYFFGLASANAPQQITAGIFALGAPPFLSLAARAPTH